VVEVVDAAGGSMLASRLPAAYEAKYGRSLDFKALGFASMSALAPRIPGVGVRNGHDPAKTVLTTPRRCLPRPRDGQRTLEEVERRILELVDEGGGEITVAALPLSYTKRYGQKLDYKALGFGRLLDLLGHLRGVGLPSAVNGNRVIRRAPPQVRILQRPAGARPIAPPWNPHGLQADAAPAAAAPAPAALSGDAGEFQPSSSAPAPAAAPRRLSGDAGEFRPASPAPMYPQPPIPPPPQGFVPVFVPPPPVFMPGNPMVYAPPPLGLGPPILMPPAGLYGHYVPNQPEPDNEG